MRKYCHVPEKPRRARGPGLAWWLRLGRGLTKAPLSPCGGTGRSPRDGGGAGIGAAGEKRFEEQVEVVARRADGDPGAGRARRAADHGHGRRRLRGQRLPHPADPARDRGHHGVRQPHLRARGLAGREPHDHGRGGDPQPVPPLRPDQRVQPRDRPRVRPLRRGVLLEVRRPALLAPRRREPTGLRRRAVQRLDGREPHRRQRRLRGPAAGRAVRLLDRDRAPDVLRPRREQPGGHGAPCLRRHPGPARLEPAPRDPPDLLRPPQPRGDRRLLRGRPRRGAGRLRDHGAQRPRFPEAHDAPRPQRVLPDDRLLLREPRRHRRGGAVPQRGPPLQRSERRRGLRPRRHRLLPRARGARPLVAPGAGLVGGGSPGRVGARGPPAAHGDGLAHRGGPQPDRVERLERPGRRGSPERPRLGGGLDPLRGVAAGPLAGREEPLARGGAAPRLERRQPADDPLAPRLRHPAAGRRDAAPRGGRALHPEPRLREAHPVRLLRRPLGGSTVARSSTSGPRTPSSRSSATSAPA